MYTICIQKCKNHFEMKIGCTWFFFGTKEGLVSELTNYLSNHEEIDKEYNIFKRERLGFAPPMEDVTMMGSQEDPILGAEEPNIPASLRRTTN